MYDDLGDAPKCIWTLGFQETFPMLTVGRQHLGMTSDLLPFKVCWKPFCIAEDVLPCILKQSEFNMEGVWRISSCLTVHFNGESQRMGWSNIFRFNTALLIRFFIILNSSDMSLSFSVSLHLFISLSLSLSLYCLPLISLKVREWSTNTPKPWCLPWSHFTYQQDVLILTQVDMASGDCLGKSSLSYCKPKAEWDTRIPKQIYDHLSATLYSRVHQMTFCCETTQCSLD